MEGRVYIAIDLKSFYASVECVERGLDPLDTNLLVADASRTEKTICLAVSPSLKAYGISGRARLFEAVQQVEAQNSRRLASAPGHKFSGSSYIGSVLAKDPSLKIDYITAVPRMAHYIKYSTMIYGIYLKYIAPEDIHVYSIDEVFMDVTDYLKTYSMTPGELAMTMVNDVLSTTGITATAGIGTNLYLCKIAMDIVAKHMPADKNGVRIAELDEMSYRKKLWAHRPLTDFWRIGHGYAKKLEKHGMYTMGDIARCSVGKPEDYYNEDLLYRLFGINAELLIDHAWGWEPCTIADIKAYRPRSSSISSGQVLTRPYTNEECLVIIKEMADGLALDLVDKGLVTNQIVLTVCYDVENLKNGKNDYKGKVRVDHYGRAVPEHSHGTFNFPRYTSSSKLIVGGTAELYGCITDSSLLIRRVNIAACNIISEAYYEKSERFEQTGLFDNAASACDNSRLDRERKMQKAMLSVRMRFGKNAVVRGMSFEEGATAMERNRQIGGHRA